MKMTLHEPRFCRIISTNPAAMNARPHDPALPLQRAAHHRNCKTARDEVEWRAQQSLDGAAVRHPRKAADDRTGVQSHVGILFQTAGDSIQARNGEETPGRTFVITIAAKPVAGARRKNDSINRHAT
jgi:hypothetical protein